MELRRAQTQDLAGIAAIYDREVTHGIATFMTVPYSGEEWRDWLAAHSGPRHPALVACEGGAVLGWASLSPWSARQAYNRAAESSVYVAPGAQGRGVGAALMGALIAGARAEGIGVMVARVVDQNAASVRFHERMGFGTVGVMRRIGEKFGRLLDVRLMDLHIDLDPGEAWKRAGGRTGADVGLPAIGGWLIAEPGGPSPGGAGAAGEVANGRGAEFSGGDGGSVGGDEG